MFDNFSRENQLSNIILLILLCHDSVNEIIRELFRLLFSILFTLT